MGPRGIVIFCGLLMSLSAFSIDISLPFFTRIASSLGEPLTLMPLTVTVFLFCMGLMQMVFGPFSDRFGRKPALVVGLCVFLLGTVVAGLAPNFSLLIAGRALQGIGASAAFVISRAILRDLYTGAELARQLSLATAIFSVGPIVAPLIGATLILLGGDWRLVFLAMFVYTTILFVMLVRHIPETNLQCDPDSLMPAKLLGNFKTVLGHPQSRWFMMVNAITQISMILIIATVAPLYEIEFGVSGIRFALYFALHAFGIIFGQMLNRRLIARHGPIVTAMATSLFMIVAGLLVILVAVSGIASAWMITALVTLFAFGYLSVAANTMAVALMPHGRITGFTASLLGTVGMLVSSSVGMLIGGLVQTNAAYWGMAITVIPMVSVLLMFIWYRTKGTELDNGDLPTTASET